MRRTLLLGLCRPAREPTFDPALASPPAALCGAQWDPKPGRAAPPYTGGSSKAPHTAPAEVFFARSDLHVCMGCVHRLPRAVFFRTQIATSVGFRGGGRPWSRFCD